MEVNLDQPDAENGEQIEGQEPDKQEETTETPNKEDKVTYVIAGRPWTESNLDGCGFCQA